MESGGDGDGGDDGERVCVSVFVCVHDDESVCA